MRTVASACLVLGALPVLSGVPANWQPYQRGPALELSINHNALWRQKDGLVHFINQERFTQQQFDSAYRVRFAIRRTQGYADCIKYRYVLAKVDFYTATNRHVWSTLHPVPRHSWLWHAVPSGSVAAAMMDLVCGNDQSFLHSSE